MHLIITGATGTVGSAALHAMIRNPAITEISILSRRPVPMASNVPGAVEKCTTYIQKDFSVVPAPDVLAKLKGAHGCVWAQGISQNEVPKQLYREITFDYPLLAAKTFAEQLPTTNDSGKKQAFNFVYVSGEGVTTTPGMLTARFGVIKGEAEAALLALGKEEKYRDSLRVYSARPAAVDKKGHTEVEEAVKDKSEKLLKRLEDPVRAMIRVASPGFISPTYQLGDALVMLASGDGEPLEGTGIEGEGRTIRNFALRRLAGL